MNMWKIILLAVALFVLITGLIVARVVDSRPVERGNVNVTTTVQSAGGSTDNTVSDTSATETEGTATKRPLSTGVDVQTTSRSSAFFTTTVGPVPSAVIPTISPSESGTTASSAVTESTAPMQTTAHSHAPTSDETTVTVTTTVSATTTTTAVPTTTTTVKTDPAPISYEAYLAMTPEQQQAYFEAFTSVDAFFAWHTAAKAEYEENKDDIEIGGDGDVDIGDIIGGLI